MYTVIVTTKNGEVFGKEYKNVFNAQSAFFELQKLNNILEGELHNTWTNHTIMSFDKREDK